MNKHKELQLIEGKYVHKKKTENIFIANLRRALPTHIPRLLWEKEIESAGHLLSREEIKMLRSYYILHKELEFGHMNNGHQEKKIEGEYYVLLNVPHFIEPNILNENNAFTPKEIEELKYFYSFNEKKNCYILNKSVRDVEEVQILTLLKRKDICMSEREKYQLALILEKLQGMSKENVFYAHMVIDLKHPFFFEHPTEHVPGMMILEAARQFNVAYLHKYVNVPMVDFSLTLDKMEASFNNYLELHHPIRLKGVVTKIETDKRGVPRAVDSEVFILQKETITAIIKIGGKGITKGLFNKLRRNLPKESERTRYYPMTSFYHRLTIRQDESNVNLNGQLINLSLNGFCIEIEGPILMKEGIPLLDFIICFDEVGFIFGKCRIVWQIGEDTRYYAGIEIVNLTLKDRDNLYEAIKRYCYVIEEREIL